MELELELELAQKFFRGSMQLPENIQRDIDAIAGRHPRIRPPRAARIEKSRRPARFVDIARRSRFLRIPAAGRSELSRRERRIHLARPLDLVPMQVDRRRCDQGKPGYGQF